MWSVEMSDKGEKQTRSTEGIDIMEMTPDELIEQVRFHQLQVLRLSFLLDEERKAYVHLWTVHEHDLQVACGFMFDIGMDRAYVARTFVCSYCDAIVPKDDIKEHISNCEAHPMTALRRENEDLKLQLLEAKATTLDARIERLEES